MSEPTSPVVPSQLRAALQGLAALRVPFRGPFITPRQNHIYVVDDCILTAPEILALHQSGDFTTQKVQKRLDDFRRTQKPQPEEPGESGAQVTPEQRRRSQRVMLRLNVLVQFALPDGGARQTHAFTVAVNAHGGLLEAPFRLTPGQHITLINPQTAKQVPCRVVRVHQSSEGHFATAFEFAQPSPLFWQIAFPPPDWGLSKEPV